jgi:hypothetical protein
MMTQLERAKRKNRAYIVSYTDTVAKESGTTNLHIKNLGDSERSLHVHGLNVATQFPGFYTVYDRFTAGPTGGTSLTTQALLADRQATPTTSIMEANKNVTHSGDDYHSTEVFAAGGKTSKSGGAAKAENPIVEPGRELVIEITNTSVDANDASIMLTFSEDPEVFSDFL